MGPAGGHGAPSRSAPAAEALVEGDGQDDDDAEDQALDLGGVELEGDAPPQDGRVDVADDLPGPHDDDPDQEQAEDRAADRADAAGEAAPADDRGGDREQLI